ncbi:MAG TPA: glycosyltransferase [Vicinamibacterales bacterium]|nr:glycosyltransferase [Vicinamibacterales bacterium]
MRVLMVHNTYRGPGGEDVVARHEADLLRDNGHEVLEWWRSNAEFKGATGLLRAPAHAVWALDTRRALRQMIADFRPQVMHIHNFWMAVSPSAHRFAKAAGIAVVQTLHNFRLLCCNGLLFRDGAPCERCLTKRFAYPGVVLRCYRRSAAQSLLVAGTMALHRAAGTWDDSVDAYIALTEFAKGKFVAGGLPADKIVVKPNFIHPDPGVRASPGDYAISVGRLSGEKGLMTMLRAWTALGDIPLRIVGDGPLMADVQACIAQHGLTGVETLGYRPPEQTLDLIKGARFLIFPSECYESFPMTILEAFACGVPVIASRRGSMSEIVHDGQTGLLFAAGEASDLAQCASHAWTNPHLLARIAAKARAAYEAHYSAPANYPALIAVYERALARVKRS